MVDLVFASDANFVEQIAIASASAVNACNPEASGLVVHVLDCGIPEQQWKWYESFLLLFAQRKNVRCRVLRHVVDMARFASCPPGWTNGSKATWARILLPEILKDIPACVYSDGDVLFIEDPSEILRELRQCGAMLVGHRNPYGNRSLDCCWALANGVPYDSNGYVCCGLIGMDLDRMRAGRFVERSFQFVREHPDLAAKDQTVLNWFCHGHVALLSDGWGCFNHECHELSTPLKAIHYSSGWPWARTKNAYDWIGYHCSREDCRLWDDFRTKIAGLPVSRKPRSALRHVLCGALSLMTCRVLNALGVDFPGHPCFSEMVRAFDAKSSALAVARRRLFGEHSEE